MHTEAGLRFLSVARVRGVRVGVTPNWLIGQAVGWVLFSGIGYASVTSHLGISMTPAATLWLGLMLLLVLNLTVLVHEGGHALAALVAGLSVQAVVLAAYGGATIRQASPGSRVDRWTAAGGPLANLAMAAACLATLSQTQNSSPLAALLLLSCVFQALNGVVNLLPIGRCDGSRIFFSY